MNDGNYLEPEDAAAIVKLLGDVVGGDDSMNEKRRNLVNGLAKLIDLDYWVWVLMGTSPEQKPTSTLFLYDGIDETELAHYLAVQEHPELQVLTVRYFEALKSGKHVTSPHHQYCSVDLLETMDIYPTLIKAKMHACMLAGRKTARDQLSLIGLFRDVGKPFFSERDCRIAHIVLSEVEWLHETIWPQHPRQGIDSLSPRQRSVNALLLQGMSRKQIADLLGLAPNTVQGYIKEIYAAFGVNSHVQLMRHFTEGDGGDQLVAGVGEE